MMGKTAILKFGWGTLLTVTASTISLNSIRILFYANFDNEPTRRRKRKNLKNEEFSYYMMFINMKYAVCVCL